MRCARVFIWIGKIIENFKLRAGRRENEEVRAMKNAWLEELPCGLKIDLLKGECCMTVCPEKRKTCEEIENCEYWIKGNQ